MNKVVLHTKFDDSEGRIGWKKLLMLCSIIIIVGGFLIFGINNYILNKPHIFEGKVISIEESGIVSFEMLDKNHETHEHNEFAKNTNNIELEIGDIVAIQSTAEGNIILEVKKD